MHPDGTAVGTVVDAGAPVVGTIVVAGDPESGTLVDCGAAETGTLDKPGDADVGALVTPGAAETGTEVDPGDNEIGTVVDPGDDVVGTTDELMGLGAPVVTGKRSSTKSFPVDFSPSSNNTTMRLSLAPLVSDTSTNPSKLNSTTRYGPDGRPLNSYFPSVSVRVVATTTPFGRNRVTNTPGIPTSPVSSLLVSSNTLPEMEAEEMPVGTGDDPGPVETGTAVVPGALETGTEVVLGTPEVGTIVVAGETDVGDKVTKGEALPGDGVAPGATDDGITLVPTTVGAEVATVLSSTKS